MYREEREGGKMKDKRGPNALKDEQKEEIFISCCGSTCREIKDGWQRSF